MWEDSNYCWVVLCKNHWFHMRENFFFRHKIPLAETDAATPLPSLGKRFTVRCDKCGKTYTYKPKDVLRVEQELPEAFKPHPLFHEEPPKDAALNDWGRSAAQEVRQEERPKEEPPQKEQLQGESRQEEPSQKESPQDESPQSEPPREGQTRAKGA